MGDLVPHLSPSAELPGITPSKEAKHRVRVLTYDMSSFVEQCVSSYLELAGRDRGSLRDVPMPFLDESSTWEPPEGEPTGALAHIAIKVLMKILYVVRMARPDLLRATCMLARNVSRWCNECDRRLHRLVSYKNTTQAWVQHSYVGDNFDDLRLGCSRTRILPEINLTAKALAAFSLPPLARTRTPLSLALAKSKDVSAPVHVKARWLP